MPETYRINATLHDGAFIDRWLRELEEAFNHGEDVNTPLDAAEYLVRTGYINDEEIVEIVAAMLYGIAAVHYGL